MKCKSLFFIALCGFISVPIFSQTLSELESTGKFAEIYTYVSRYYVEDVDEEALIEEAITSMLAELDPHTVYIPKKDVQRMNESIVGSFEGIGVRFQILNDTILVVNPIPGGPSYKLGIMAGDKIVKIEEEVVAGVGITNLDVRDRLLGEKDSKVNVKILRGKSELIDFEITRDKIPIKSVISHYMVDDEIGYTKITSFSRTTTDEFRSALKELKDQGMESLILDLRGNGGGLLSVAKDIADEFLADNKLIVYSEGRRQPRRTMKADEKGNFEKGKLVVLIDESSASASEIVTGAIQDWDRGIVVGRRSFGKGLVQRPIDLRDGSQIRLTIAKYYTPSGRNIQKPYDEGVEAYKREKLERYLSGEMISRDSVEFPDSLQYKTLVNDRIVYGGGGIMPDVFVPIDTSYFSELYRVTSRKGYTNEFSLNYVNDNRKKLKKQYKNFDAFNEKFDSEEVFEAFLEYLKEKEVEINEKDLEISSEAINLRIKALMAQNLYVQGDFYQVVNNASNTFNRAVQILKDDTFDRMHIVYND